MLNVISRRFFTTNALGCCGNRIDRAEGFVATMPTTSSLKIRPPGAAAGLRHGRSPCSGWPQRMARMSVPKPRNLDTAHIAEIRGRPRDVAVKSSGVCEFSRIEYTVIGRRVTFSLAAVCGPLLDAGGRRHRKDRLKEGSPDFQCLLEGEPISSRLLVLSAQPLLQLCLAAEERDRSAARYRPPSTSPADVKNKSPSCP